MTDLPFVTLDVFTETPFTGNPLAVFPAGEHVPEALMPRIAAELNLSETVFVLPAVRPGSAARLRIFTPTIEMPFAGHPVVGTTVALAQAGRFGPFADRVEVVLDLEAGPAPVTVERAPGGLVRATLTTPRQPVPLPATTDRAVLAALLGLPVEALAAEVEPGGFGAGVPFTIIPLASVEALAAARLDLGVWRDRIAGTAAPHVHVVFMEDWRTGREIRARMFAPAMGIAEDPATGAAAAALAGWLADRQRHDAGTVSWTIRQGVEMGRPSTIELSADLRDGRAAAVRIGGTAVAVGQGAFLAAAVAATAVQNTAI